MAIYDRVSDFRSIYLTTGSYQNSSGTYPDEYTVVTPNSYNSAETMQYLGHDLVANGGLIGYEKFRLKFTNPNAALSGLNRITDVYVSYGSGYSGPALTPESGVGYKRPILSTGSQTTEGNYLGNGFGYHHFKLDVNDGSGEYISQTPGSNSTNLDFSFYNNERFPTTHAVVVLIQNGYGYKCFGHYASCVNWNFLDIDTQYTHPPMYSNDAGATWPTATTNANGCYMLKWKTPTVANMNQYKLQLGLKANEQTATRVRVGIKNSLRATLEDPFVVISPDIVLTNLNGTINNATLDITPGLNMRDLTCGTYYQYFCAPIFASAVRSVSTNGYRNGESVFSDWYGITA
jgi:hypothetical protein